ncbi:MAG: HesA/MoeB/ThiF family protein [Nitrospirae bacterium]|nr:HesA/MoeB/ThiF family protein [Nitrospirota bacterium]
MRSCHNKSLSDIEKERYKRQMTLNGFGEGCQSTLKSKSALIAGIGGLGGNAAVYLAAAGIGRLVIAHYGKLTMSNLNRQILMKDGWVGKTRVAQAKKFIEELNPEVEVEIYDERISEEVAEKLLPTVDIALSARPNFYERRELNKASVAHGVPMVEAAMNAMEGYLFNVIPGKTPCLNCVFPEDDPGWQELGFPVLGAVSGALGCLMAIEAIKILTGFGKPLLGKMLMFNTYDMEFKKLSITHDPMCSVCG